jgi:hypothetical protein
MWVDMGVGLYACCRTKHWPLSQINKWKQSSEHVYSCFYIPHTVYWKTDFVNHLKSQTVVEVDPEFCVKVDYILHVVKEAVLQLVTQINRVYSQLTSFLLVSRSCTLASFRLSSCGFTSLHRLK